jgi:hypothetical protein
MKRIIPIALLALAFAVPGFAQAQRYWPWGDRPPRERRLVPRIGGTWYMNGDDDAPCQIIQRGSGRHALFINENGSRARGTVRGGRVFIPDWSDGESQGLVGRIRGNRIIWPNGTFWSR